MGWKQWRLHRLTLAQDLTGLAEFRAPAFQRLDPIPVRCRHTVVFFGLLDAFAQDLRIAADLGCDGPGLCLAGDSMLRHHPHGMRADLSRAAYLPFDFSA